MMGSGTTLVEAMRLGRESIGADLNPISVLVARVKTTPIAWNTMVPRIPTIPVLEQWLHADLDRYVPEDRFLPHWFSEDTTRRLAAIRAYIESLPEGSEVDLHVRNLLQVALISIIRRVSTASNGLGRMFRDPHKRIPDVFSLFRRVAYRLAEAVQEIPSSVSPPQVIGPVDARDLDLNTQVGLVICHPPYFNLFRYSSIYKFELLWLGVDPQEIRRHEIREGFKLGKAELAYDYVGDLQRVIHHLITLMSEDAYLVLMIGDALLKKRRVNITSMLLRGLQGAKIQPQRIIVRIPQYTAATYMTSQRRVKSEVGVKTPDHLIVFKKVG